jgi:hypothetical protein
MDGRQPFPYRIREELPVICPQLARYAVVIVNACLRQLTLTSGFYFGFEFHKTRMYTAYLRKQTERSTS